MDPSNTSPSERRQKMALWLLLIFLILAIACIAILVTRMVTDRQTTKAPQTAEQPGQSAPWADRYCYAGTPRPTAAFRYQITVLTNSGYLVGYCESRKDPVWAAYRLFRPTDFHAPPRPREFEPDHRTTAQVSSHDYTGSGYDRGHMAPNYGIAVCYGASAQQETFLMSNIIPQRPHLNREVWERLEQQEIREYAPRYRQIWVVDGPIFHGHDHLKGGEDVPDACFKIICREVDGRPSVMAFIMPQSVNGNESPQQYLTSVDKIEQETGLDFFSAMPADLQQRFETEPARGMW